MTNLFHSLISTLQNQADRMSRETIFIGTLQRSYVPFVAVHINCLLIKMHTDLSSAYIIFFKTHNFLEIIITNIY